MGKGVVMKGRSIIMYCYCVYMYVYTLSGKACMANN